MKEISLHAPREMLVALCQLIRNYAEAAYPQGGSECAQASRSSLMETANRIENSYDEALQTVNISRRIKTHVTAAIEYYQQLETGQGNETQATARSGLFHDCLAGSVITEQQWQATC